MRAIELTTPVGELVREQPARSEVFDALEIDYCCGGENALDRVCEQQGIDVTTVVDLLHVVDCRSAHWSRDSSGTDLPDLCDEIEREHHPFLRRALPKIRSLAGETAGLHGEADSRFYRLDEILEILDKELRAHVATEKEVFFPFIRGLEHFHGTTSRSDEELRKAVAVFERDHDGVGDALGLVRELTDGFTPPTGASDAVNALYEALWELSKNVREHVHKENNVLFPKLREMTNEVTG